MADWNLNSPLLANMQIVSCLSQADGIATYVIQHNPSGQKYIFKNISIPASQTQVDGLRYSGAVQTSGEAQAYYERVVADHKAELEALKQLSETGTVDRYLAYHIQPKEEAVGFDLQLVAEYRETLAEYMQRTPMTHLKAANLAMDLCNALSDLRNAGYIHCNIKPENIFLNNQGHFMLGDLGLYRVDQLKYAAVSERVLGKFTAPELFDVMQNPNTTVDIYTIGLILYNIYNGGHRPFEDEKTSTRGASEKRISGSPLPAPIFADYEMAALLQRACAFLPEDRFQTPEEFRDALLDYAQRNEPRDEIIVPPIVADDDVLLTEEAINEEVQPVQFTSVDNLDQEFVDHFSPDTASLNEIVETIQQEMLEEANSDPEQSEDTQDEMPAEPTEEIQEEPAEESQAEPAEIPAEETAPEEPPVEETAEGESAENSEETPETPSEDKPKTKTKKKMPIWAWILIGVGVLAGLAAAAYFTILPNVTAITAEPDGSSSIVLTLDANRSVEAFTATCTDTYGNAVSAIAKEGKLVFENLNPGTQYTIDVSAANGLPMRGQHTVKASTLAATEVLYFIANPISETQAELNFAIAGSDQKEWKVQYGTSDGIIQEVSFQGHNVVISNLVSGAEYTFTLVSTGEVALTGDVELKYNSTIDVVVEQILAQKNENGIELNWTYAGNAPQKWSVICRSSNGTLTEQAVTEPHALLTDLAENEVYTVEIVCSGMATPAEKILRTADAEISGLTVAEGEGELVLSWTSADAPEDGWMIICTPAGSAEFTTAITAQETTAVLQGLFPNTEYTLEVQTGSGFAVRGEGTVTVTTPSAKNFGDYGCTSTYLGMFLAPAGESWTYRNLATSRSIYSTDETIAFALESLSGVQSSEDAVAVMFVVTDSNGAVVSAERFTENWNSMWDNNLFVGSLENTPQTPGNYKLQIFFNGDFAGQANFQIIA